MLRRYVDGMNAELSRKQIIEALIEALKPLDYIYAFYEGGAAAFKRIDEWSDIDLYIIVDDNKVDETFIAVEKALKALSPLKQKFAVPQLPWPGVSQAFYKLENASDYLLIDLAILKLSSPEKFLEPEIHGNVVFYFNKNGKVKPDLFDKEAFSRKLQARLERLQARFAMFNNFVQKELNRGNYVEAVELYHAFTLASLTEVLRIKYNPFHHDFKMRYVHYELPKEIVQKLADLSFIKDKKDLQEKYDEASRWFQEIISKNES
jgi:predicted nucleotidyltransferase